MLMPDTNYGNLAAAIITSAGTTLDNSLSVSATDGATFPATPFYATIMKTGELTNSTNGEIVKVTGSSTSAGITTFTITRAQRGTSATEWDAGGAILSHAVYVEDMQSQSQGYYQAVLSSGSAFTITNASAPTAPVVGSTVRVVFGTAVTTQSTVTLAINGGTAYNVAAPGATYSTVDTVSTNLTISTSKVYDLEFDGTQWVMSNSFGLINTNDINNGAVTTTKIADSAVTTAKIADTAVTPTKLDLGKMYYGLTVNGEFQATSLVSKGTLTVPAGTYLVGVNGHAGTAGASDTNYSAGIYAIPGSLSGTAVANASYYFWQGSGVIQDIAVDLANMRKVTFSSQTTLYLGVSGSGNLKNFSQVAMWAIRIA